MPRVLSNAVVVSTLQKNTSGLYAVRFTFLESDDRCFYTRRQGHPTI